MRLTQLLDPDRNWLSPDKWQHFGSCFLLCALADTFLPTGHAFLVTVWTAAVYESGQADIAYNGKDASGQRFLLGKAGFGWGVVDFAVGTLGAGVWVLLRVVF